MANRQKRDVDCTVRTVCTEDDVVGCTDDMVGHTLTWKTVIGQLACDVFVGIEWDGDTWPNQRPPRVTYLLVKTFALSRSRPRDLRGRVKLWERPPNRRAHACSLLYICKALYLTLFNCMFGRGPVRG
jgi:hypothetical protein